MNSTYIIAEAGVNHNGNLNLALQLCDKAKEAAANAVKFQTFKTEKVITKLVGMAQYQKENIGKTVSQYEMAKGFELTYKQFEKIKKHCDDIGITFLSTPDEEESLNFLLSLGLKIIKIGSPEVGNIPFLRIIASRKVEVILSTGMSTLGDVEIAYFTLLEGGAKSVALLHCTTNYPCLMNEVNLRAMVTLKNAFKTKVGYSDHTIGNEVSIAAVAMGAEIIEKHFTLDKNMEGPDHKASSTPEELAQLVNLIRNIEIALGSGIKRPFTSELDTLEFVKRSIVAARNINKGELFTEANITLKRAGNNGIGALEWDRIIGKIAVRDFKPDEIIEC